MTWSPARAARSRGARTRPRPPLPRGDRTLRRGGRRSPRLRHPGVPRLVRHRRARRRRRARRDRSARSAATPTRRSSRCARPATTPPGSAAMGFCLLNNIAVAGAALAERGERVLILDWDVHHGNGTQDIFWDDPRVLYVSTHQSPFYPGTGSALGDRRRVGGRRRRSTSRFPPAPPVTPRSRAFDEVVAPARRAVRAHLGARVRRASTPTATTRWPTWRGARATTPTLARRVGEFAPEPGRLRRVPRRWLRPRRVAALGRGHGVDHGGRHRRHRAPDLGWAGSGDRRSRRPDPRGTVACRFLRGLRHDADRHRPARRFRLRAPRASRRHDRRAAPSMPTSCS